MKCLKKYINYNNKKCIEDRDVVLKKLHNSQNVSDKFLNEVNKFIIILVLKEIHYLAK